MASLVVQSRFAGLKIEDDDYPPSKDSQKSKKNKLNSSKKPCEVTKKTKINNSNNSKTQNTSAKKKKVKQPGSMSAEQWDLWKQKDEELVDGNFESELHQAILLSKLDFEEKKDIYKQFKKESEIEKKLNDLAGKNSSKKQKKKNVMSLGEFNEMVNPAIATNNEEPAVLSTSPPKDTEFFERIKDETKNELLKDKIIDRVKHRAPLSDEIITRVQFADALEKKDHEIAELRLEVANLKQELLTVKSRNKKLCNILGQGEMKDKAEVLVEVERLRAEQGELTAEIAALHRDLERERSRHDSQSSRPKDKKNSSKKRSIRFDVSSEALSSKESSAGT